MTWRLQKRPERHLSEGNIFKSQNAGSKQIEDKNERSKLSLSSYSISKLLQPLVFIVKAQYIMYLSLLLS